MKIKNDKKSQKFFYWTNREDSSVSVGGVSSSGGAGLF